MATKIADRIRGKDKPTYTPHTDGGDYVVVINAEKIQVTGKKSDDKKYYTHLYPGGLKSKVFKDIIENKPEYIIEEAVKGMLPKNKLGKKIFKKLKVYKGDNHPHESQEPKYGNQNMSTAIHYATGRRKTSSARVYLSKGKGKILVNNKGIITLLWKASSTNVSDATLKIN